MSAPSHGEEDIIQRYFAPLAAAYAGAFGLKDDCAALTPPPGCDLIVKTDPIRAGVHFFTDDAAADVAWKALAVNISDLAAKGAAPLAYTMALSFPDRPTPPWLADFAGGLRAAQTAFGCHLIGGDTDRATGPLSIAVTAFGVVPAGKMVRRGTARAGDVVYVSGTLGDAALGLRLRRQDADTTLWPLDPAGQTHLRQRYLRPAPRTALAPALLAHARAAMDISDGLGKDFHRLCRASGVGGAIALAALPLSPPAATVIRARPALAPLIWSGGDDYEILCTLEPSSAPAFEAAASTAGVQVTAIGHITADPAITLRDAAGGLHTADTAGYDHF